jgi:hypothetical protein
VGAGDEGGPLQDDRPGRAATRDPQAFATYAGRAAEDKLLHLFETMQLPPRSPDLNPLDYKVWLAVRAKMRAIEKDFAKGFKEKLAAYWARLERTALGLSKETVDKITGDMHRRVAELVKTHGKFVSKD